MMVLPPFCIERHVCTAQSHRVVVACCLAAHTAKPKILLSPTSTTAVEAWTPNVLRLDLLRAAALCLPACLPACIIVLLGC